MAKDFPARRYGMGDVLDLNALLGEVIRLAHEAGSLLVDRFKNYGEVEFKGEGDIVTEADKESERLITSALRSLCPDHAVLGEEFGGSGAEGAEYLWAIDPLDGTANYAGGLAIFSVSIALLHRGEPVLGVVHDPNRGWTFHAVKGEGAFLNGERISVNSHGKLSSTGLFGVSTDVISSVPLYMRFLGKCRSLGSAALHICHVAMGVFDGCVDIHAHLWDVAAAALILQEAGGRFTDLKGAPHFPLPPSSEAWRGGEMPFVATNGLVHEQVLGLIDRYGSPPHRG